MTDNRDKEINGKFSKPIAKALKGCYCRLVLMRR